MNVADVEVARVSEIYALLRSQVCLSEVKRKTEAEAEEGQ